MLHRTTVGSEAVVEESNAMKRRVGVSVDEKVNVDVDVVVIAYI